MTILQLIKLLPLERRELLIQWLLELDEEYKIKYNEPDFIKSYKEYQLRENYD